MELALKAFRDAIGAEHVLTDPDALERAASATFRTSARPAAIVRPADRAEVRSIVRIAKQRGVALHPVSRGKNWGFGSRVPTRDGLVLVELARLDRIVAFDEELAYVTLEPGVSFRQLYQFLRERQSRLFVASTGATPDASVVGNALERGDGSGPYGDRVHHVCALEAVLGTGEVVHTGFARFDHTPLAPLHRFGVGPALDGLLSQSNFAIVTELTAWLCPLPRALSAVRFSIRDRDRLGGAIDAIRQLRLDGTLRAPAGIWNDHRVLSTLEPRGSAPAGDPALGASWFGLTSIYAASPEQAAAHERHVRRLLGPVVDTLEVEQRSGEPVSGAELFHEHDPGFQFLQGIPHEGSLKSVYYRKPSAPERDLDPDRDRCGVLWSCPVIPLSGEHVQQAASIAERILVEHGFDPLLAAMVQTDRTAYLVPLIVYDRDQPEADDRALSAHDALLATLVGEGYLPYRLGIQSMDALPPPRDDWARVLKRLQRALDPADVISPGRYDFRRDWPDDES